MSDPYVLKNGVFILKGGKAGSGVPLESHVIPHGNSSVGAKLDELSQNLTGKITTPNNSNFKMYFPNEWNNTFFAYTTKTIENIPANGDGTAHITFTIPNMTTGSLPKLFVTPYTTSGTWCYCTTMVSSLTQTSATINVHNLENSAHSVTVAVFIVF